MSFIQLVLVLYATGFVAIGIPMGVWSLRAWRTRNGKKKLALRFLFPWTCAFLGQRAFEQGIATYECGKSLIHLMVSEDALLNGVYDEDTESRLACASYVFVSAFSWPLRCVCSILATVTFLLVAICWLFFVILPRWGGKLLLLCNLRIQA